MVGSIPIGRTKSNFMENTTEEKLPLSSYWEKNLEEFELSQEVIERIGQLRYYDGVMIKKFMNESEDWRVKYFTLQRKLRDLL